MRKLRLQSLSIEKNSNAINLFLGGSVTRYENERILEFDNEFGTGTITGIPLDNGISFMQYDLRFQKELKIQIDPAPSKPIYFMYCLKGSVGQNFGGTGNVAELNEFQTAIVGGTDDTNEITFPGGNQSVKLFVIRVTEDPKSIETASLQKQLYTLFSEGEEQPIRYFGTYNLRIGEQLAQIGKIKQQGVVKKLLVEGILNLTLAMEVQHLKADLYQESNPTGSLTQYELNSIKKVSRKIEEHPERQYSIKSICSDCGLSASKLQEGFKLLHNKTVSDFIRNERLNTAERLISTTDMNISEIVYTVGLSSRSYFSKIFKRRYKCSPKMYQDNKKDTAVTA